MSAQEFFYSLIVTAITILALSVFICKAEDYRILFVGEPSVEKSSCGLFGVEYIDCIGCQYGNMLQCLKIRPRQ